MSDRCHYDYRQSIWHGDEEEKLILSPLHSSGWHEIIEEYSQRQLFEPSRNKLNATSTVAQEQGKPQQYVAGLWRKRLESDSAWRVVRGHRDENCTRGRSLTGLHHGHGLRLTTRSASGFTDPIKSGSADDSGAPGLLPPHCLRDCRSDPYPTGCRDCFALQYAALLTRIRCQLRPESVHKSPIDNIIFII